MNGSVLTVVANGNQGGQIGHPPSGTATNGDVNIVNNLYSSVDRSQKQQQPQQQHQTHNHRKISEGITLSFILWMIPSKSTIDESVYLKKKNFKSSNFTRNYINLINPHLGHSGDSTTSDIDQLYAKVSKKSKRPSPPPNNHQVHHGSHGNHINHCKHVGNHSNGNHSPQPPAPPPAHPPAGAACVGAKFEHNNNHSLLMLGHIGSILPPMTLKRKNSRPSTGDTLDALDDDDNDPCYEMVGGRAAGAQAHTYGMLDQDEPKYERLKGYAYI